MIHIQGRPYQLVLWESENRFSDGPALQLEFESLEEAQAVFEAYKTEGIYRSGIMMEWHKHSGIWDLLDRYPA